MMVVGGEVPYSFVTDLVRQRKLELSLYSYVHIIKKMERQYNVQEKMCECNEKDHFSVMQVV